MATGTKRDSQSGHFGSMARADVPKGRNGKHKDIVGRIISDLQKLDAGRALRIPLADLPDTKENIRSALSRVTRQMRIDVSTTSDADNLYIWKSDELAAG
jgi:hypothetical protein